MMMTYKPEGCFCVLGFTKSSSIPRADVMGTVNCVVPADATASLCFSAFAFAMFETNRVAIVRFCTRGRVHLGALFPSIKTRYDALLYAHLPFAEDMRDYAFPSLHPQRAAAKYRPSDEQLSAAGELIDSMNLVSDGKELLKPKYTLPCPSL
jgi:ATP-dependent DNA helicase 2 subunit 2